MKNIAVVAVVAVIAMCTVAVQVSACTATVNCHRPTAVAHGHHVPIWHVVTCLVGPAGGPYKAIDCRSPKAIHISPRGEKVVCFLGSDQKVHWDYQWVVKVGRKFKNHLLKGRWQPDWQE